MAKDYEVGYGKPPKHTRWGPGKSGNPSGRTRGAVGLKTDLAAELDSSHTIQINKQPVTGTKQRLMIKTLATRAATGDIKAAQVLLPLILQTLGIDDRGREQRRLSAQDQAILDDLLGGDAISPEAPATPDMNDDNKEKDDA